MKHIVIAQGAVNAKLVDASKEDKLLVQQMLSYTIDGFEHMQSLGTWDGRSSFFNFDAGTFPAGFVVRVYREFKKRGRLVQLVRKPLPVALGPVKPVVDAFPEDPRYDYQAEVVGLVERFGQIIAQVATGGGKSRIAKLSHARIARPTLFLTTRGILMHQMRDAFVRDLKVPVGIYGDDEWSPSPHLMNVGMVQTFAMRLEVKTVDGEFAALTERRRNAVNKELTLLTNRMTKRGATPLQIAAAAEKLQLEMAASFGHDGDTIQELRVKVAEHNRKREETVALLSTFELLILEEAHEASSDSYYRVTRACTNAHYRLSLTATPFMKDSEQANLQLEACSGPVAIKVSEQMLIQRGILAKPYFKFISTGAANDGLSLDNDKREIARKFFKTTPYQLAYEIGITGLHARNQAIVDEVKRAAGYGLSSMVLVQHKVHGRRLADLLTQAGVRCAFIEGEHNQTERQAAIRALKSGQIQCLIGSTILDVGVDVPAVGLVVLAGGGKAEVAIRQRIGRGLREKKDGGPNVCFIVDFVDPVNNHLRQHARDRRQIIETTPGFVEGVVSDFPYEALGFALKAA
jgi:superfamily II DNA or RNA helicase